jgi:SOS-response transcriptional repressor LexA
VLAQHRGISDPETGDSFTVKRYRSANRTVEGEVVGRIELEPLNPDFDPIVLTPRGAGDAHVIAELVAVLGGVEATRS